jgi:spermidine synthase
MTVRHQGRIFSLLALLLCLVQSSIAAERIILERKSPYNNIVVSEDDWGMRILRFERSGARQTVVKLGDPDHLELPYARVLPIAFIFVEKPASALVIGLGGGTIPSFLRKRFPKMKIDAVDIDPGVVDVAKTHFGFREDAKMRAHVEDGRRFVEQSQERYDLIFLDGFGTDSVPPHLSTREFLQSVRRLLTPRGVVIGNLWGRASNRLYDSMVKTYRAVYDDILIIDVPASGNKILIACPWKIEIPGHQLLVRARSVSAEHSLRYDIVEVVERNVRAPGEDGLAGDLLKDAEIVAPARR